MTDFIEVYDTEILLVEDESGSVLEYVGSAIIVGGAVQKVNGQTGDITLTAADVAADPAGTAEAVRTGLQSQIDDKADAAEVQQALTAAQTELDGHSNSIAAINQQLPNLATQTYVLTALTPKASIVYVDSGLATKADALATSTALATKATVTQLNEVKALAETNQLNIGTKVDQVDFDSVSDTVTAQGLTLLNKADIAALTTLAQLVDTKADQSYVISEIARITGNAPAALDTLAEIAEQLGNDQTQINNLLTQIGNRLRFDAAQSLTTTQQTQARDNINAEKAGTAASLVAAVTPASIGAATAAQGDKANSALQSGDVAPVALSGSFSDLVNKSSMFNLVYSAYALGSNAVISASDSLGQMLGKLQAQISSNATNIDTKADAANTLAAINSKEPTLPAGTTAQYLRGDKTWQTLGTAALRTVGIAVNNVVEMLDRGVAGFGYGITQWSSTTEYATFNDVPKRAGWFKVKDGAPATTGIPTQSGLYGNNGIMIPRHSVGYHSALFFPYYYGTTNSLVMRTNKSGTVIDAIVYSSADPIIYNTNNTELATARFVTVQSTGEMRSVPPMPTQAASTATDVAGLRTDLNALIAKLKANGLML